MSVLLYRRPEYVPTNPGYLTASNCQRYVERANASGSSSKIPDSLSFDAILENKTLPPCALGDFMDYLMYVAHDAENLQFFLWYRDYCARFEALDQYEKNLSPEWKGSTDNIIEATGGSWPFAQSEKEMVTPPASSQGKNGNAQEYVTALPSQMEKEGLDKDEGDFKIYVEKSVEAQQKRTSAMDQARKMNKETGVEWAGCKCYLCNRNLSRWGTQLTHTVSIQPYRQEITRIITHYLAPSAPRRLNLAPAVTAQVLHALQHTTHPSAFTPAISLITLHLRHHSHANFIRWSICNGNKPRVFFVKTMGILHTALGFIIAILLVLSHVARWWRIFAAPVWFIGISTLVAAYKGLCVILHANHQRAVKPWEDPAALYSTFTGGEADDEYAGNDIEMEKGSGYASSGSSMKGKKTKGQSLDTFGSSNDGFKAGDAGWVDAYKRKSMLSKVFDVSHIAISGDYNLC